MTEGDQLRTRRGARSLQDEGDGGDVRLLRRRRRAEPGRAQTQAELAGSFAVRRDDGKPTVHGDVTRGRRAVAGHNDGARPEHRQSFADLRRGQLGVDRDRRGGARSRDNRQGRVRAARKRDRDSSAAVEAEFT